MSDSPLPAAALRAARRLHLSRLFLQVMAQEMPDSAVAPLRIDETADALTARAPHLCGGTCDLTAHGCLTALKVQAMVGRDRKSPFAIATLAPDGDHLRVRLVPAH
jgi:hypothetical protein